MLAVPRHAAASVFALVALLSGCDGAPAAGTGLPATLGDGCTGGACACEADATCEIACPDDADCAVACEAGSTCSVDCGGAARCDVACDEAASCAVDCASSPDCRVACPAEDCTVENCELDLGCAMTCADGDAPAFSVTTLSCD